MRTCLIDYVGIVVCADQEPSPSGLYLNSLPGISLESMDKIANEDQLTFQGLYNDIQAEANAIFLVDFRAALSNCYDLNKSCDYEDLICSNKKILVNAWRYLLGAQFMLFRKNSTRLNRFTLVQEDQIQNMIDEYQARYEKFLAQAVQLIDLSGCLRQLVADPSPKHVVWRP